MIFYFTGTGNTLWVARQIAEATGEQLLSIADELHKDNLQYQLANGERLGFCFPTHGWQPPRIVRDFLRRATFIAADYCYAVTTCGDNMGHLMRIWQQELETKGLTLDAAFAVVMPESNVCFPFLHLDTKEREAEKIAAARPRVAHICQVVKECRRGVSELVQGAIPYTYSYIIGGYYNKHLIRDDKFWVDEEACSHCGLCRKLCPVNDIAVGNETSASTPPRWLHNGRCTNCLACYHHCPRHAIHWGKMKRGQYYFKG